MTINYDNHRLDAYPGGSTNYPEIINNFIDANYAMTLEIEAAREDKDTLVENLIANYIGSYTITKDFDGDNNYRFTNMADGTNPADYVTKSQLETYYSVPGLEGLSVSSPLNIPYARLITGDYDNIDIFSYASISLSNSGTDTKIYWPGAMNSVYFQDMTSLDSDARVNLAHVNAARPILGDRLIFIFTNTQANQFIIDSSRGILGNKDSITFGTTYNHAIYDMVYASVTNGWHITNLILG